VLQDVSDYLWIKFEVQLTCTTGDPGQRRAVLHDHVAQSGKDHKAEHYLPRYLGIAICFKHKLEYK
jgi:hypothetical protein